jgi:hypothetical protein
MLCDLMTAISLRRVILLTAAGLSLAAPAVAGADIGPDGTCTGDPIAPDRVITGSFPASLQGSYVMVPVTVPRRTEGVRVKYCYSQPAGPTAAGARNTLDLGLWDPEGFRGWGGSSHPDVTVSRLGFSSEAQYRADPRGDVPGRTTRGFLPGRVPAGRWEVELGVGGVLTPEQGNPSGTVDWRVEVDFLERTDGTPYRPARYDRTPARRAPGWYTGDLHVHAEHSALGDATMREVFEYAFRPLRRGGAGLDFVTLSDYVTSSAWGEIGRHQADHPGRLIVRSAEVITYRGHTNNHASATYVDHRLGPVYELAPDGGVRLRRGPRPPRELFRTVQREGGFTQINHPRIFPSEVSVFALLCRGCPWDYSDAETDLRRVDAIELATGPATVESGDDPDTLGFTRDAIAYYQRVLATGAHVAAVAVSDSHDGGSPSNPVTERPIGQGATVVRASELSERGITAAVRAGHTYAKLLGSQGPDLRFSATARGRRAIMGDTIRGGSRVRLRARVDGATATAVPGTRPYSLVVQRDGVEVSRLPVTSERQTFRLQATGPGRWGLQLERGRLVVAVTTPIWVTP